MPNWCCNVVTLRHKDPAMIERAAKAFDRGELLNEFMPLPQELKEGDGWYNWCVNNWGTKWDVGGDGRDPIEDPNVLEVSFESAWAPPTTAYEKLCALGFEIEAYYWEPGMAFCGKWTGNEEDFDDDYYEYGSETSETVRALIGDDLDERFCISEMMAEWEAENQE